jgi:hypothetical protein
MPLIASNTTTRIQEYIGQSAKKAEYKLKTKLTDDVILCAPSWIHKKSLLTASTLVDSKYGFGRYSSTFSNYNIDTNFGLDISGTPSNVTVIVTCVPYSLAQDNAPFSLVRYTETNELYSEFGVRTTATGMWQGMWRTSGGRADGVSTLPVLLNEINSIVFSGISSSSQILAVNGRSVSLAISNSGNFNIDALSTCGVRRPASAVNSNSFAFNGLILGRWVLSRAVSLYEAARISINPYTFFNQV